MAKSKLFGEETSKVSSHDQLVNDLSGDIIEFLSTWTESLYISPEARKKIEELAETMAVDIEASGYDLPDRDFEEELEYFANMDQFSGSNSD